MVIADSLTAENPKCLVHLMREYGAQNEQEAREAARNLMGFARLCLEVKWQRGMKL